MPDEYSAYTVEPEIDTENWHRRFALLPPNEVVDPAVEITILNDNTLRIGDTALKLGSSELFIFNSMRYYQGFEQTGVEIQELGYERTPAAFSLAIRSLRKRIHEAAGEELIPSDTSQVTAGRGYKSPTYILRPDIAIYDERLEQSAKQQLIASCVQLDRADRVKLTEQQEIAFFSPMSRERVASAMLREYANHPDINRHMLQMLEGHLGSRTTARRILPVTEMPSLAQEEPALFEAIEKGLQAYVAEENPTDEKAVLEAVNNILLIYMSNLHVVSKYARSFSNEQTPYDELYQAGATTLLGTVMRHKPSQRQAHGDFYYTAGKYVSWALKDALEFDRSPVQIPPPTRQERRSVINAVDAYEERYGIRPSVHEIAQFTEFSHGKVEALLNQSRGYQSIDTQDQLSQTAFVDTHAEDNFERVLDQMIAQESVEQIFGDERLTDKEKIVLSLHHKVFSRLLQGAEFRLGDDVPFTYPYDQEAFEAIANRLHSLSDIDAFMGARYPIAKGLHHTGARKGRAVLLETDDY